MRRTFIKTILFLLLPLGCYAKTSHHSVNHTSRKHSYRATSPQKLEIPTSANILTKISNVSNSTNSVLGVTAIYIEKNKELNYHGDVPVFMASTAKIPIAYALLHQVDQNQLSLDRRVRLSSNDSVPGSGGLRYILDKKPLDMSLKNLLVLMLTKSDNSASDAILREVNGPQGVQKSLARAGLNHTHVNRSFKQIFIDAHGTNPSIARFAQSSVQLEKMFGQVPLARKIAARKVFDRDLRDTSTPNDMALLLAEIYKGHLLSQANTQLLMRVMQQCKTGSKRIKGMLPANVLVAHKTGTWSITPNDFMKMSETKDLFRFTSDVGVITLPQKKGHIAIAVYVKSKSFSPTERSRVIAQVSQYIYSYFLHIT